MATNSSLSPLLEMIAVAGLGWMHEQRRRSGGSERGGNLAANMSALAHAHDHHPAAAPHEVANRFDELVANARPQGQHSGRLNLESLSGKAQQLGCIKVRGVKSHATILSRRTW